MSSSHKNDHAALVLARRSVLLKQARKYGWWLGKNASAIQTIASKLGWNLSRRVLKALGKPQGAITWPLGLGLLFLNQNSSLSETECLLTGRILDSAISRLNRPGQVPHIDCSGLLYAAMRYETLTQKDLGFLAVAKEIGNKYASMEVAQLGLIPYTPGRSEILIDTLGMLCPFLARLARLSGNDLFAEIAIRQIETFTSKAIDIETGWMFHAFNPLTRLPMGEIGWGRGIGWLLLGATDTLLELEPSSQKENLRDFINALLEKIWKTHRKNGHWTCNMRNSSDSIDSSVTAFVTYSLSRLILEMPQHFKTYNSLLEESRLAIDAVTTANGEVMYSSGEAGGVGNYSQEFGSHLWTQGLVVASDAIHRNLISSL